VTAFVHPTAVVDEGAVLGEETRVWHFCHVSSGAVLGAGCSLGQNVFVAPGVRLGERVKVQNNVSIYAGVTLEDYVFCGPSMVFTNVRTPRSAFPRNTAQDYAPTLVQRGASLGANCTVVCGLTIGPWAFVGAGAVVTRDVPAHALMAGVPARRVGWACACGVRLAADSLTCPECARTYVEGEHGLTLSGGDALP
jgi:UDP-2-acetamido-3-amino-2,3-dideoxy-glucuronate N-acetyltransferase